LQNATGRGNPIGMPRPAKEFGTPYCRTVVGGSVTGAMDESVVIGFGGGIGRSLPAAAGGIVGPGGVGRSSLADAAGAAATTDAGAEVRALPTLNLFEDGAALVDPFNKPPEPEADGNRLEVPGAGAAGTTALGDTADGGARPPDAPMLAFGWFVNCGVLPIGAARADGSPCDLDAGCCDQADPDTGAEVEEVGNAVGGVKRVGVAVAAAGR
jgi:hypothetical protein